MESNDILDRAIKRKACEIHGPGAKVVQSDATGVIVEVSPKYAVDHPCSYAHEVEIDKEGRLTFGERHVLTSDQVLKFANTAEIQKGNTPIARELLGKAAMGLGNLEPLYQETESILKAKGLDRRDPLKRRQAIREALTRRPDLAKGLDTKGIEIIVSTFGAHDDLDVVASKIAVDHRLNMGNAEDREAALVLALEQHPRLAPAPYGPEAQLQHDAGGPGPLRAMAHICRRDSHRSLTSDWYEIRRKMRREYPEWACTLESATSIDEATEAILLADNSGLTWARPEDHQIASHRAASRRPDLLAAAYGPSTEGDTENTEEPVDPALQAEIDAGERLRRMAEDSLKSRGLDYTNYELLSAEFDRLVRNDPSILGDRYGAPNVKAS